MTTPDRHSHPTDSARRRLLRGGFSVPAVLTLTSGSALAAASATCLAKATLTPSTAPLTPSNSVDTLMRIKLRKLADATHVVARADLGAMNIDLSLWATATRWQRFGVVANTGQYNMLYGVQETSVAEGTPVETWVALRFNAAGSIVGMGLSGAGSVVGNSCWMSVQARPR